MMRFYEKAIEICVETHCNLHIGMELKQHCPQKQIVFNNFENCEKTLRKGIEQSLHIVYASLRIIAIIILKT